MQAQDVQTFLRDRPFEPFRVTHSDGRTYDVKHPDMVMVGQSSIVIGVPSAQNEAVYHHAVMISLLHVMQIEPLNGQGRT